MKKTRSTDLILPDAKNEMAVTLRENLDGVLSVLRSTTDRQRFASSVIIAANTLPEGSCWPKSVVLAALHAATIGLVPGKALRHCYFIPRKLRKGDRLATCQLELGYPGYLHLCYSCDYLRGIYCDWVLRGEQFEHGMLDGKPGIEHQPAPDRNDSADALRKAMVGAYCYWQTTTGFSSHRYLTRQQIDMAEGSGGPVWKGRFYGEMVLKTTILRAAKWWNLTDPLAMAVTLDEQLEAGEEQSLDETFDVDEDPGNQPTDLAAMAVEGANDGEEE